MRLIFDIETDGFLDTFTKIHSLVIKDVDTGEVWSCHDLSPDGIAATGGNITRGVEILEKATEIIGHNIIEFDIPVIQKLYPDFNPRKDQVIDTLVYCRMLWPEVINTDMKKIRAGTTVLTPKLAGTHKLEAWGMRLGILKGTYSSMMEERGLDPWASWNPEMQEYCEQDVEVTEALFKLIEEKPICEYSVWPEHAAMWITAAQQRAGFMFDVKAAEDLYFHLSGIRAGLNDTLTDIFKPWWKPAGKVKTPKQDNSRWGYIKGAPFTPVKLNVFNPNSNQQIEDRLRTLYGWKPVEMTPSGQAKLDEEILGALPYPEAKDLAYYQMIQKRIGQLAEGNQAWLKQVKPDGRIHGRINSCGAITTRSTHSNPNIGQVPAVSAQFGRECRSLFPAPPGRRLLGCDVSGLELRMLAHYMAAHDGGAYGREVIEGDVHTLNQQAAGLPTRDAAKTFIYAFLYGAGNLKLGTIAGGGAQQGAALKAKFLRKVPALGKLLKGVKASVNKKGTLRALDGRSLKVRHKHAALNTLLQSAGALVCKLWMVRFHDLLEANELTDRVTQVAWIHDELQMEIDDDLVREDGTSIVGDLCVKAIKTAGEELEVRIPLTGEYKIGATWADTH